MLAALCAMGVVCFFGGGGVFLVSSIFDQSIPFLFFFFFFRFPFSSPFLVTA